MRIIYKNADKVCVVVPSGEVPLDLVLSKDVPDGVEYAIVEDSDVPSERTFRNAWEFSNGAIAINLAKAKAIAHEKRRELREKEFEPFDNIIAKQIPGNDYASAEIARQAIRDKYTQMQVAIDAAVDSDVLLQILGG